MSKSIAVQEAADAADEAMAEKHRAACKEIREHGLSDLLDWLQARYTFAVRDDETDLLEPTFDSPQKMLELYFEIDMAAVERYRQRLIRELQQKASA